MEEKRQYKYSKGWRSKGKATLNQEPFTVNPELKKVTLNQEPFTLHQSSPLTLNPKKIRSKHVNFDFFRIFATDIKT